MKNYLLKNAVIVNEGKKQAGSVYIKNGFIEKIGTDFSIRENHEVIDLKGAYLLPGCIDDQVHFREPGLTQKGTIATESRAAVAGGITSFMEMPNTVPNALTQQLLEDKYQIATQSAIANYSFYMGTSNENIEEVLKTDPTLVCGLKIFMGSSTGNMLVDSEKTLDNLFSKIPFLIATHCEDEATIRANKEHYKAIYGDNVPIELHPIVRSEEACYISSSLAVNLAKKHGTRLHVLHISTEKELSLFDNQLLLEHKKITAEACVHHLWFSEEDYKTKGNFIKWNPAVKKASDREAIWKAVLDNRIDVIATDHAPHTLEEKQSTSYFQAPSGGPLVQHALLAMLEKMKQGYISIERVVEKMAHAPAIMFQIEKRGFIREGYYADLVVVTNEESKVEKSALLYKCGWSPFEGVTFAHSISKTFINGNLVWSDGAIIEGSTGQRMKFNR